MLGALVRCRTEALGGHLYVCSSCGHHQPHYNSCRDRHCPGCQSLEQARWVEAREERVLPVGHHHVVFTVPSELRTVFRFNDRVAFEALFDAVQTALVDLALERGVRLGVTAVLHTWTRELRYHPHVHCVVTGGGLSRDDTRWIDRRRYLLPAEQMKSRFREALLDRLRRLRERGRLRVDGDGDGAPDPRAFAALLQSLPPRPKWVLYIERPFAKSKHVLRYLGRYTHRVAITDQRLVAVDGDEVRFRTRGGQGMTLVGEEFVRRFLQHVLPRGLRKIRHFGLYAPTNVQRRLPIARSLIGAGDRDVARCERRKESAVEMLERLTGRDVLACPACAQGRFVRWPILPRGRGPPRGEG